MKRLKYMIVDTETATLDFVPDIARNEDEKKTLAIAKPLVYDIGWTIMHRDGTILQERQFLIAEIFSNMRIFNTAYYREKRPIYLEMLAKGETTIQTWNYVMQIFIEDLKSVDFVGAFNSMFDFKKAIPFTEKFIEKMYSPDFYFWEENQYRACEYILNNKPKPSNDFDKDFFFFRNEKYPLFDIWGIACKLLLNNRNYKDMCLKYGLLTESGDFFKTSAETTFRYLCKQPDFIESHTALDDAKIESFILSKCLKRKKIEQGIIYFPFRLLENPAVYASQIKNEKKRKEGVKVVLKAMSDYVGDFTAETYGDLTNYKKGIVKKMLFLSEFLKEPITNEGE